MEVLCPWDCSSLLTCACFAFSQIPGYDIVCIVGFWSVWGVMGLSMKDLATKGWTVSFGDTSTNAKDPGVADVLLMQGGFFENMYFGSSMVFGLVDFDVIREMIPNILLMAAVGPVFNTAVGLIALKEQTGQKCHIDDEAFRLGFGHIVSGLCGGFAAATDNVESEIFKGNGGKTKASVFVLTAIYFAFLSIPFLYQFAQIIPYPMLGGLYFYLGFDQLFEHLGLSQFQHMRGREYLMIWAMLILYVGRGQQILEPLVVGTAWAILFFLRTATMQNMVFYEGSASCCPSYTARPFSEQKRLRKQASHTHIVRFNGILSFAQVKTMCDRIEQSVICSADEQTSAQKNRGATSEILRYVFDFEMVQKIDTTAGKALDILFDNLISMLFNSYISGLRWKKVPKPETGSPISNVQLADALQHATKFTRKELEQFGDLDWGQGRGVDRPYMSRDCYIEVGESCYKPDIGGYIIISGTLDTHVKDSFLRHSAEKIRDGTIQFFPIYDQACTHVEEVDLQLKSGKRSEKSLSFAYQKKIRQQVLYPRH